MSAPNVTNLNGSGGLLPFLSTFMQGYQGAQEHGQEQVEKKAENQRNAQKFQTDQQAAAVDLQGKTLSNKAAEIQIQDALTARQTAAQQLASTQLTQLNQQIALNPSLANDPTVLTRRQQLVQASGTVVDPAMQNGKLNPDVLKPQWNSLTTDQQNAVLAHKPGPERDAVLAKYGGVPKNVSTLPQFMTTHDLADITRATTGAKKETAQEKHWTAQELMKTNELTLKQKLTYAKIHHMGVQEQLISAQISKTYAEAAAIPQRLNLEGQRLGLAQQRLGLAINEYTQKYSPNSQKNLMGAITDIQRNRSSLQNAYNVAEGQMSSYVQAKGESLDQLLAENDPIAVKINQNMHMINEQLYQAERQQSRATNALSSMVGPSKNLGSQAKNPVRVQSVNPPKLPKGAADLAKGVPDGTTGDNGKYIARGGYWYPIAGK